MTHLLRFWSISLLLLLMGLLAIACGEAPEKSSTSILCSTSQECTESSTFAEQLGRCVSEAYCRNGACVGSCVQACAVVDPHRNPCREEGFVCNQAASATSSGYGLCSSVPIPCHEATDCPVFLPIPHGAWECRDGACRFPGFTYGSER